jgi:3-hydroxyisobutyrate dehydrogenase
MCGGDPTALEPIRTVIQTYSARIELLGQAGKGQHAKMANQILLAGNMIGTVEALIYGKKAGLDLNQLIETLKSGLFVVFISHYL